ncbi:MAG: ADP-ribosylglycohydrolase family protein [Gammaproteobacteria bacterium]|nr:ADP-ribosylglycohydrolase family protein [Gammaproteobacteria bacterium]
MGALLGLAAGDALGTTLEFTRPSPQPPLTDMVGGGPFGLEAGQWTDDTSMALCLAESLVTVGGFDPADQMHRYLRWRDEGHLSSTGRCFDIGGTVSGALHRFAETGDPFAGETHPHAGGNGSLMRLAPVALAYGHDTAKAVKRAGEMSRTTHGAPEPVDACRYYSVLLVGALDGLAKAELLDEGYRFFQDDPAAPALAPAIADIAAGSFRRRQPPEIRGTGYVVQSLEAALWAFWHAEDFESGALAAVNLGEDADTTGAIYGQLAGACFGVEDIPARWRASLAMADRIVEFAEQLFELRQRLAARDGT